MNWYLKNLKLSQAIIAYHGSASKIDVFNTSQTGPLGPGIYFTSNLQEAKTYANIATNMRDLKGGKSEKKIYKVSLNINKAFDISNSSKNPTIYDATGAKSLSELIDKMDELKKQGYDGVIARHARGSIEYSVFSPSQIKILEVIEI